MSDTWPVESEREFSSGDVTCVCGRTFHLWWNGGELDSHLCACGRMHATEHRSTVLVVRTVPPLELAERRNGCKHGSRSSDGVCQWCGTVVP